MKGNTGSGSATNAGIDYQQRVSAWFLTMMFTRTKISPLLELPHDLTINSVRYETEDHIDDLKLGCTGEYTLYLQIKRQLSLSDLERSDFYKTIDQFMRQFIEDRDPKAFYILATSPDSSSAIKKTLKKLTEANRLNQNAFEENPLSKEEDRVFTVYKSLTQKLYKKYTSDTMTDNDFAAFTKQVYINVLDVESGGTHETVAITMIAPLLRVSPELIWALLIKNSLDYAKKRLSITSKNLDESLESYRVVGDKRSETHDIDNQWKLAITNTTRFDTGKEVVLVESFLPNQDYLIMELFRFDEQCNKPTSFKGSVMTWDAKTEFKVICRMASEKGMHRFIEENPDLFKDKSLAMFPANNIEEVEETPCARLHADLCIRLLQERKDLVKCLHCGKPLSQHWITLIELDDSDSDPAVGGVHEECRRPIDRVLGRLKIPFFEDLGFLKCFDIENWIKCYIKGQGLFNDKQGVDRLGPIIAVAWNPSNEYCRGFNYCVQINLKDGTFRHLTSRGKLDRYSKQSAETCAAEMNRYILAAKAKNDPACYTSITGTYGPYSRLVSIKEDEEECIEYLSAVPVLYSEQIGSQYPTDVHWYSPLLYLVTGENESTFMLRDNIVFLTSPLNVGKTLRNWEEANVTVGTYEMRIIESDQAFDKMVGMAFGKGFGVVVDPLLDRNGKLAKGYIIADMRKLVSKK